MSWLARWTARRIWWALLWISRRRWARNLQKASLKLVREERREYARKSMLAQNKFARRYGLPLLTLSVNLVLGSVIITVAFMAALRLQEVGAFTMSDELREKVFNKNGW